MSIRSHQRDKDHTPRTAVGDMPVFALHQAMATMLCESKPSEPVKPTKINESQAMVPARWDAQAATAYLTSAVAIPAGTSLDRIHGPNDLLAIAPIDETPGWREHVRKSIIVGHLSSAGFPFGEKRMHMMRSHPGWSREDAVESLLSNPYQALGDEFRIPFRVVDRLALDHQVSPMAPQRLQAAAAHVMRRAEGEPQVWVPEDMLAESAMGLCRINAMDKKAFLHVAMPVGVLVHGYERDAHGRCWGRRMRHYQRRIATAIAERQSMKAPPIIPHDVTPVNSIVSQGKTIVLSDAQADAVQRLVACRTGILTGGPGTGKTTVLSAILKTIRRREPKAKILCAAPTGKAAQRMTESTGFPASTMHRLLGWHKSDDPPMQPIHADWIIMDESSMLDIRMTAALLHGAKPSTRLLFIGDVDQLPPVGPGSVLSDLIQSGVTTCRLTEVRRQGRGSPIVAMAQHVHRGIMPTSSGSEASVITCPNTESIAPTVIDLATRVLPKAGFSGSDIRILTAGKQNSAGTMALNRSMQDICNPLGKTSVVAGGEGESFRVGDPVIWTVNDPNLDLVNGQDLIVAGQIGSQVVLRSPQGRTVRIPATSMKHAHLSYAMTIHKSQGSEYPAVIAVVSNEHDMLLERRLLYTAITRAKKHCTVIGTSMSLHNVLNDTGHVHRFSGLHEDVRTAMGLRRSA